MRFALGLGSVSVDEDDPLPPEIDRVCAPLPSLEQVYRQERTGLLRFVTRRSRREDAEDVVQQAFTRFAAGKNASRFDNPGAYLRQTSVNLLRDEARWSSRHPKVSLSEDDEQVLADCDPLAALEARDRLHRIGAALDRLKPLTRQIFLACRVYGYSHAEIAEQTGLSVKGVEKHMGVAIKQLGRHLRRD